MKIPYGGMDHELASCTINSLPPTVNHLYSTNYHSRVRYKTAKGRAWQEKAVAIIRDHKWFHDVVYTGTDVNVSLVFDPKNNRRWDIDNRVKAVLDCLVIAGVIKDDSQIQFLSVARVRWSSNDSTMIKVSAPGVEKEENWAEKKDTYEERIQDWEKKES